MSVSRGLAGRCIRPDGSVRHQQDRATGAAAWAAVHGGTQVPRGTGTRTGCVRWGSTQKAAAGMQVPPRKKQTHWPHPTAQKDPKRVSVLFLFHAFLSWHARARPILAAAVPRAALARPSGTVLVFSGVLLRSPEFSCVLSRSLAFCSVLLSSACSNHTAASCWWTNSSALPVIFGALGAPGCSPGSPRRKQRQLFWVEQGPPPGSTGCTSPRHEAPNRNLHLPWYH